MAKKAFNAETHKPRALTRAENKLLRKSGFHPNYAEDPKKIIDDMTDYILDNFYKDIDFDNASQADCVKFASETFQLTYGVQIDETKNS